MTELIGPQEGLLLHELNHRGNNEFAGAISVVPLKPACAGNKEVKSALSEIVEVLHPYADVHRALQMAECDAVLDATTYLRELCRSISQSYLDHRKIKLVLSTEPLRLKAGRCWRLGMIVNELIIISARHAFSDGDGEIRVELLRASALVECSVADNGSADQRFHSGEISRAVRSGTSPGGSAGRASAARARAAADIPILIARLHCSQDDRHER